MNFELKTLDEGADELIFLDNVDNILSIISKQIASKLISKNRMVNMQTEFVLEKFATTKKYIIELMRYINTERRNNDHPLEK